MEMNLKNKIELEESMELRESMKGGVQWSLRNFLFVIFELS